MKRIKHKWVKVVLILSLIFISLIIAIFIFAVCFLNFYPTFGGSVSKENRLDYAQRSEYYNDGKFYNPGQFTILSSYEDNYADRSTGKGETPEQKLPAVNPEFISNPTESDFTVTWFGHSSLLLQMQAMNILFDPVFSERSSPVSFVGPKRYSDSPVTVNDLPHIDIVIISHDHYDHLDYNTILQLKDKTDLFIVPLGVENHLKRWGVAESQIRDMAWWEQTEVNGLTVACTPARHYSGRSLSDSNATLWASWVLKNNYYSVFESGDTGYGSHFQQITQRYGNFDFALLDCAQYSENWHDVHMFPEEAAQAALELQAKKVMPIHWGAFSLSDHAWDDSAERLVLRCEELGISVITPKLGETASGDSIDSFNTRWWRDIK